MTSLMDDVMRRYPGGQSFRFGDGQVLCAQLLALVRQGKKTATTGALRDYEGAAMPVPGRYDIALDWDGTPALVIETLEIRHCRFCDITEAMALAEGEDADLAGWQAGHRAYFERNGGFDPHLPVVWERFRLVEDLGTTA